MLRARLWVGETPDLASRRTPAYSPTAMDYLPLLLVGATLSFGCFSTPVTDDTDGASTGAADSSGNPPPGMVCIPGETQNCLCLGGGDGVQACNEQGTGYSACECEPSATTDDPPDTGDETGADTGDETGADTGGSTSGSSGGGEEDSTSTTGTAEGPYQACNGECSYPGEECVSTGDGLSTCALIGCETEADCPVPDAMAAPLCVDLTGVMKTFGCVLPCGTVEECIAGQVCEQGICLWEM